MTAWVVRDAIETPLRTLVVLANTDGSILGGPVGPESLNGDGAANLVSDSSQNTRK